MLRAPNDLSHKNKRFCLVVAERLIFRIYKPIVDFILSHDAISPIAHNWIACHQKIAQETERLFFRKRQRFRDLFPIRLQLCEILFFYLGKEQVLQQVHRVQPHAALVDRLEDLQCAAHVGGDLDEDHAVRQITPVFPQRSFVLIIILQVTMDRLVGVHQSLQ